jgi:MshEN domain
MAIKIGELLVREKLITLAQLEEALKSQVIFGGRLGTNLIEMGLLEENDIARMLSKKLGVPFLDPPSLMMNIPTDVLAVIPKEYAAKYQIIPLRLDGRRLTLGMVNPAALKIIDEIAFLTSCVIRPVVVPEVRIVLALEKHYKIERKLRYIHSKNLIEEKVVVAKEPEAQVSDDAWFEEIEEQDSKEQPKPVDAQAQAEFIARYTVDHISKKLADAKDRDDIADTLVHYLGQTLVSGAMFLIRSDIAMGWKAVLHQKPVPGFDLLQIPLNEPSILKTVAESQNYYLGPIPRTPFNSMILQEFGGRVPKMVLLIPLVMMGRTVGIIYADGEGHPIGEDLSELQKLATKAVMAFEILILKNKILQI